MSVQPESVETDFLVLRTVACGENSLVASGVSPQFGRVSFLVWGGQSGGRRRPCVFGLFRRLQVRYVPQDSDMQTHAEATIEQDYGGVSQHYERYEAGCYLARFALDNVLPGMSAPVFFEALVMAFRRLSETSVGVPSIIMGVLMVYMQENGLLPPFEGQVRQAAQCQLLLDMALGGDIPALRADNWLALCDWALGILARSDCLLPPLPSGWRRQGRMEAGQS